MSSLPTDSFKISITTSPTAESNNNITSQPTSSPESENVVSLNVETPEKIKKHTSQISSLYTNQELNRSATSLSTVDYIVPSNDPRSSTQIYKLQSIDYSTFSDTSPLGDSKSIKILVSTWKNDKDMTKIALKKVESLVTFSQALKDYPNENNENKSLVDNHPQNILVHNGQIMISDLGISKAIPKKSPIIPTLPYIDPNYLASPNVYPRDKHLDIYSLGVLMHDVSSGKQPFENLPYNQLLAVRLLEGLRLNPVNGTPLELVDLYEQCWDNDANVRPTISDILARLGRLKLDPVWVDNDDIIGNGVKKKLPTVEFNDDIKGIILESKHAFGTGSVSFSNGNISEEEDLERGCIRRRHKFAIFICWIVIFCAGAFSIIFFGVIKFATSKN
ncbi:36848_t:CDS:2 [Gigaspora margarita]|uniref:36848_t:CDS:1 n=1 Tax=Gigaspora margarita TaxID=4874 RepID=A0ABN7UKX1_GIGMA|nr:36848_t:CDS:2 [Gigaspora margarita]